MKTSRLLLCVTFGFLSFLAATRSPAQSTITEWTFDNLTAGSNTAPAPSTGSGSAASMGMAAYLSAGATPPAADDSNIYNLQGTDLDNSGAGNLTWRIVGNNGWNSAAAIGTQGAQFNVSTMGYAGITVSFDVDISKRGEADLQLEYTTNGSTWINAALTFSGTGGSILTNSSNANIVTGSYLNATFGNDDWYNQVTANLTGVTSANNDANFGIRIVNAATGSANVDQTGTALNNTSGNWRLDDVQVQGTSQSAPEPSTWAMLFFGLVAFIGFRHRRARSG